MRRASQGTVKASRTLRDRAGRRSRRRVRSPPGMVDVRLFGGVRVAREGAPTVVDGRPARALLCWLALHRGPQPRALVAARLWPGVLDDSARVSLRAALSALRRSLGPAAVIADRESVALAENVAVDVRRFDALLGAGRRAE